MASVQTCVNLHTDNLVTSVRSLRCFRFLSGITDIMFRHPAPAVTKRHVVFPPKGNRATNTVTTAWGTLWRSDCFRLNLPSTSTWGSDPLLLLVSKGGGRRGVEEKPLGYVSEWEWQSLKCCAMFVIRGPGCRVKPRYCRLQPTSTNKPLKPPTLSHIPLYQRHYWSKTLNALWSKSSTTTIDLAFYSFST